MPDGGERGASNHETGTETQPKAYGSIVETEGEEIADGKTDDPVADDLDDEAGVGVARTAQGPGGGYLEAIEELEYRSDKE